MEQFNEKKIKNITKKVNEMVKQEFGGEIRELLDLGDFTMTEKEGFICLYDKKNKNKIETYNGKKIKELHSNKGFQEKKIWYLVRLDGNDYMSFINTSNMNLYKYSELKVIEIGDNDKYKLQNDEIYNSWSNRIVINEQFSPIGNSTKLKKREDGLYNRENIATIETVKNILEYFNKNINYYDDIEEIINIDDYSKVINYISKPIECKQYIKTINPNDADYWGTDEVSIGIEGIIQKGSKVYEIDLVSDNIYIFKENDNIKVYHNDQMFETSKDFHEYLLNSNLGIEHMILATIHKVLFDYIEKIK